MTSEEIELIEIIEDAANPDVYKASDQLARIGSEEVLNAMISRLSHSNEDTRFLAARTLGKIKENELALNPLLEAVQSNENQAIAGDLLMVLEDFDVSDSYIVLFKLYLFGSYKVSKIAKELLDYKEFTITPRVLKKASKAWNHYSNNIKQDDAFDLQKEEVMEMLDGLKQYLEN